MSTLRVGESSGRFDVPPAAMAAYHEAVLEAHRLHVLGTTETAGLRFRRATRKRVGEDYRVQGRGEHMLITRRGKTQRIGYPRTLFVNQIPKLPAWKQMRPVVINHRIDGIRVRFILIHGPATIQSGAKWNTTNARQVENARKGWARLGRNIRAFQRKYPDAVQILMYDCNLDLHMAKWLRWLEDTTDAEVVWKDHMPSGGTHGGRLIDGISVVNAHVEGAKICHEERPKGLDHKAIWSTLAIGV